jgi:hypothetical protein
MSVEDPAPPSADLTLERRLKLLHGGYSPVPLLSNKRPILDAWQTRHDVTEHEVRAWDVQLPAAVSTGVLTRNAPFLDLDILDEEAVRAIEDHVFARYDDRGSLIARIGLPPKRGFIFRATAPFQKILVKVVAPGGGEEQVEFLGDGQMAVIFGLHPATGRPYRWFGGEPGDIARADLPPIRDRAEGLELVDEIVRILIDRFGYLAAQPTKARRKPNGGGDGAGAVEDWSHLFAAVREGRELHDSLRDLAAKLIASGVSEGAAVNQLYGLMEGSTAPRDDRWKARRAEIPRLVESAAAKFREPAKEPAPPATPTPIAQVLEVFDSWLVLKSATPILAMLGAVAGNLLPGEPVWLGLIGPPSSAKTEILMSALQLRDVVQATTLTCAALLSGTPKRQRDKTAKGGLLRQIGEFGILSLKDFGSVLSMHSETRAELLAMLREVYDGSVTRHFGIDGGKTLTWRGKVGMIFAATPIIDTYYGVIGSMGDRFLMSRLPPTGRGQGPRALKHRGAAIAQMRKELAQAVAGLFAGRKTEPTEITAAEIKWLEDVILLAVRLRGAVERDRRTREMEMVLGAEGPARLMLTLERLLAGLDTLGVERQAALGVVGSVAMDSVPSARLAAYRCVEDVIGQGEDAAETTDVATKLGLPTTTVRRVLEDLAAYGLLTRESGGQGKADRWLKTEWETD